MAKVRVGEAVFNISQFVFDKDGLLFESQPFWRELAKTRYDLLKQTCGSVIAKRWAEVFGVSVRDETVIYTKPSGIFAVASTREEIAVTAGIISAFLRIPWVEARKLSESMFEKADENLNLSNALVSAHGFPQIFNRLKEANVPYCIATSDTLMRVHDSFAIYDLQLPEVVVTPEMVNKGKPAPDMLKFIEQKSGVPINEMAMVGDSCVDMQMATFAGAIGIGIPETEEMRKAMEPYASVIINSLDEIEILGDIT